MRKKIFILGVGAQKAGTTWLWSQLRKSRIADMGFTKEYHVFDLIFNGENNFLKSNLITQVRDRLKNGQYQSDENKNASKHLSLIDNPNNYFDYFHYLHLKDENIEIVGDITPSYSMLSEEAFSFIKEGLIRRGFEIRVVFLIRDPYDRVWSMLKMAYRDGNINSTDYKDYNEAMLDYYMKPKVENRTRYEKTISNLESVFSKDEIFIDFYEHFINPITFQKFKEFLGVNLEEPDYGERFNVSELSDANNKRTIMTVADYYRETYTFIEKRYGETATKLWKGYTYLKKKRPFF